MNRAGQNTWRDNDLQFPQNTDKHQNTDPKSSEYTKKDKDQTHTWAYHNQSQKQRESCRHPEWGLKEGLTTEVENYRRLHTRNHVSRKTVEGNPVKGWKEKKILPNKNSITCKNIFQKQRRNKGFLWQTKPERIRCFIVSRYALKDILTNALQAEKNFKWESWIYIKKEKASQKNEENM